VATNSLEFLLREVQHRLVRVRLRVRPRVRVRVRVS